MSSICTHRELLQIQDVKTKSFFALLSRTETKRLISKQFPFLKDVSFFWTIRDTDEAGVKRVGISCEPENKKSSFLVSIWSESKPGVAETSNVALMEIGEKLSLKLSARMICKITFVEPCPYCPNAVQNTNEVNELRQKITQFENEIQQLKQMLESRETEFSKRLEDLSNKTSQLSIENSKLKTENTKLTSDKEKDRELIEWNIYMNFFESAVHSGNESLIKQCSDSLLDRLSIPRAPTLFILALKLNQENICKKVVDYVEPRNGKANMILSKQFKDLLNDDVDLYKRAMDCLSS